MVRAVKGPLCSGSGVAFLFGYFLFTPGILPSALRASFAVRMRILLMRGHAKRKELALRRRAKALLWLFKKQKHRG